MENGPLTIDLPIKSGIVTIVLQALNGARILHALNGSAPNHLTKLERQPDHHLPTDGAQQEPGSHAA